MTSSISGSGVTVVTAGHVLGRHSASRILAVTFTCVPVIFNKRFHGRRAASTRHGV